MQDSWRAIKEKRIILGSHLLVGGAQDGAAGGDGDCASSQGQDGGKQWQGGGYQADLLQGAPAGGKLNLQQPQASLAVVIFNYFRLVSHCQPINQHDRRSFS